ncbi:hypothetical protein NEMBOFW57_008179 [Staphylotrichum longicolle]|uniref:VOC domain-containing protein n=1 Tax=Staphylotrichum longicolle TaxID=669026 RepID=A0AAD4HWX9_9PEZI|nr:hypothetical protein NEMBOFW57_008179 [Staphylotrichum longicolle]
MSDNSATSPKPTFFVNLPAASLSAATAFYTAIGLTPITAWSDPSSTAFLLPAPNDSVCLMLHAHPRFKQFMRPDASVVDAHTSTEALFSIAHDSKDAVDDWLAKVEGAGGKKDPYVLDGFGEGMGMYTRSWADLDGHVWEGFFMTGPCGVPDAPAAAEGEGEKKEA